MWAGDMAWLELIVGLTLDMKGFWMELVKFLGNEGWVALDCA